MSPLEGTTNCSIVQTLATNCYLLVPPPKKKISTIICNWIVSRACEKHLKDVCSLHGECECLKNVPSSKNWLWSLSKCITSIILPETSLQMECFTGGILEPPNLSQSWSWLGWKGPQRSCSSKPLPWRLKPLLTSNRC